MKKATYRIRHFWPIAIVYLVLIVWLINILAQPSGYLVVAVTLALVAGGAFLSRKVFKLHKQGPLNWYASPFIWLGAISLVILALVFK